MCYQTLWTGFPTAITIDPKGQDKDLPESIQQAIATCWEEQQQRCQGQLFNGWLFSVTDDAEKTLRGHFVPYSWYIAWQHNSIVRAQLPLCPLGISGITYAGDVVLIGRRSMTVAYYAGAYEFVPSGAVDSASLCADGASIDLIGLFQRELAEEAGIPAGAIEAIEPLAVVRDQQNHTIEICAALRVTQVALQAAQPEVLEYSELQALPSSVMMAFLAKQKNTVPLTLYLSHYLSKLQSN
jgi:hypothetical protein